MQGFVAKAKHVDYYPTVEDSFKELGRQSNTKMSIPVATKNTNQPIIETLTNQEKEEYYEVHLHISTFTLEGTPEEETNNIQLVIVP